MLGEYSAHPCVQDVSRLLFVETPVLYYSRYCSRMFNMPEGEEFRGYRKAPHQKPTAPSAALSDSKP